MQTDEVASDEDGARRSSTASDGAPAAASDDAASAESELATRLERLRVSRRARFLTRLRPRAARTRARSGKLRSALPPTPSDAPAARRVAFRAHKAPAAGAHAERARHAATRRYVAQRQRQRLRRTSGGPTTRADTRRARARSV